MFIYFSIYFIYFSIFPDISLRPDPLSDPRELDISYITYMVIQLFPNLPSISKKRASRYHGRHIDIAIASCSDTFTTHLSKCFFASDLCAHIRCFIDVAKTSKTSKIKSLETLVNGFPQTSNMENFVTIINFKLHPL